jgi:periplasmic divalent cation tolerance protein
MTPDTTLAVVHIFYPSAAEAAAAARQMVERRLAACVNVTGPCRSFYRWEGRIEETEEYAAHFKTAPAAAPALMAALAALHSYRLPAITLGAEQADADYAQWVRAETESPVVI